MPTSSIVQLKEKAAALERELALVREALRTAGEDRVEGPAPSGRVPEFRILDSTVDGIFTCDARGRITYMNVAGQQMLGDGNGELVGRRMVDLLVGKNIRSYILEITRWLTDGNAASSFLLVDVPLEDPFGNVRWLSIHLQRELDGQGGLLQFKGIARDITDQHRLQQALRRSEEHYRGIIENMNLGILEVDNQERIIRAFPKFCNIVGYDEEELLGRKASEVFIRPGDRALMDERTKERNAGESGFYEQVIRNKANEEVWLLISGVPIKDEHGVVVGSMGIHYDITERKRDEQQLERAMVEVEKARQAERAFLAKMSHEIRTPLNAVIGMSRLLAETPLDEEQREFVSAIMQGGGLLKGLLDDVLDVARLEEGRLHLNLKPTRIRSLFEGVQEVYRSVLSNKGVEFRLDWNSALDRSIILDQGALSQILLNLVGNAAKFTENGSVTVVPRLVEMEGATMLEVEVKDTGPGIPKSEWERVFDRFQQLDNGSGKLLGGSGLGLSIVRELCILHGGTVTLHSQPGLGSTFTFRMKVELSTVEDERAPDISPERVSGLRVLVAEDNKVNSLYLGKILSKWKVDFKVVEDGVEVVRAWRDGQWDLILMDVQMPRRTGLEATRIIRRDESLRNGRVPIIGLSAYAFHHDVAEGLEMGMDAYLKKPYSPEELLRTICDWT